MILDGKQSKVIKHNLSTKPKFEPIEINNI